MFQTVPTAIVDAYSLGAIISPLPASSNHSPIVKKGPNELAANNTGSQAIAAWATGIVAGPSNEATQKLTFITSTDNDALFATTPSIDANGTLRFTPKPGMTG